jgi:hypothetical protein
VRVATLELTSQVCRERSFSTGVWDPLITCFRDFLRSRRLISGLGGRVAEYLELTPRFLMHTLVTGSLHWMRAVIDAIQPLPVEQLNDGSVQSSIRLIESFTVTRTQELRKPAIDLWG